MSNVTQTGALVLKLNFLWPVLSLAPPKIKFYFSGPTDGCLHSARCTRSLAYCHRLPFACDFPEHRHLFPHVLLA